MTAHIKFTIHLVRALSEQDLQGKVLLYFLVITSAWSVIPDSGKDFTRRQKIKFQVLKLHNVKFTFNEFGIERAYKLFKAKGVC